MLSTLVRATMASAQEVKAHTVATEGIGEPVVPSLVFMDDEVPVAIAYFDWDDNVRALITVRSLIALIDCNTVALTLETFTMAAAIEELDGMESFAQAFADGDQRVREAIVVFAADKAGNECIASCPFTYEGRKVRYGDVTLSEVTTSDGSLSATMRSGFAKQATTPSIAPRDVGDLLGVTISIPYRTQ